MGKFQPEENRGTNKFILSISLTQFCMENFYDEYLYSKTQ